jgi:hypothetical protein
MAPRGKTAPPIAVGGIGGSGTRLIAGLLRELGFDIGPDLNESLDNLTFTLLFKWRGVGDLDDARFADLWRIFEDAMTASGNARRLATADDWRARVRPLADADRPQHPRAWLVGRARALARLLTADDRQPPAAWAWKEPNTHLVIDRLLGLRADLRYLHVMRNGLDMAFSGNQNQLRLWGESFLGRPVADTPADSLAYWVAAHRRIDRIAADHPGRVKLLNYDALCQDPEANLPELLAFAGVDPDRATLDRLTPLIAPPESIGRHRAQDTSGFDPDDVAYVRQLGFEADV